MRASCPRSKTAPRGFQEGPRGLQDGPRPLQEAQDGFNTAQEASKTPQEGSKRTHPESHKRQSSSNSNGNIHLSSFFLALNGVQKPKRGPGKRLQRSPRRPLRRPQDGPKRSPRRPQILPCFANVNFGHAKDNVLAVHLGPDGPRAPQEAFKTLPRGPQQGPSPLRVAASPTRPTQSPPKNERLSLPDCFKIGQVRPQTGPGEARWGLSRLPGILQDGAPRGPRQGPKRFPIYVQILPRMPGGPGGFQ